MRLPNLLASKRGRLAAFFFLYVTEGIPLGFAVTAVATQLRRQDVGPAEIGAFVGSFYLPWAFKWAFGPLIDVFAIERLGRRRGWILLTQILMAATLLSTVLLELPAQLALFTAILLVHNTFGAMQDVAIDALAVNTLHDDERGLANGLMFGGAYIGQAVGGSGVLFLTGYTGFQATFYFVAASILAVTVFIVLPMREAAAPVRAVQAAGSRLKAAGREMRDFAIDSFRSFLGTRGAFAGLAFSLLPAGAMSLGLALQSNLAVELGMSDEEFGWLQLWSTVLGGLFCVVGGWLSDRWGRRRTLFVYLALMSVPVFYLAQVMAAHDYVMPVPVNAASRPVVAAGLLTAFWVAGLSYAVFQGLMYGTRSAIMMDVTNPKVAATQFTAYMALMNLAISYSATWQGIAIEAWGYPVTLIVDGIAGLLCLAVLPFLVRRKGELGHHDDAAPARARWVAGVLGAMCLAFLAYRTQREALGAAQPMADTLFTLVFVGSALFLLAGAALLGGSQPRLARLGAWLAPLLLLMHLRYHLNTIARWFGGSEAAFRHGAEAALLAVPAVAGVVLLSLALKPWQELRALPAEPQPA